MCVLYLTLLLLQDGQAVADGGKHVRCKPRFLQSMLKDIVLAGKSMELLTSLEHRVDILRGASLPVTVLCGSVYLMSLIVRGRGEKQTCGSMRGGRFRCMLLPALLYVDSRAVQCAE